MGKLIVYHGVMGSSKSASLIQEVYNLEHVNLALVNMEIKKRNVVLMKPSKDTKGNDKIVSRFGGEMPRPVDALLLPNETVLESLMRNNINIFDANFLILDEAQFITESQAEQLWRLTKSKRINLEVICYSLHTDFSGNFFPGSQGLLRYADESIRLFRRCEICSEPAVFNGRCVNGVFVSSGEQVVIDGANDNISYHSLCGQHYHDLVSKNPKFENELDGYAYKLKL